MPGVAQTRLASWRCPKLDSLWSRGVQLSKKQATELNLEPASRAVLRLNVNQAVERSSSCWWPAARQKSLHFLGRYKPYKPSLGLAGRRRPDAAAAACEAQLALPRCHRASRARLAGGALAGGTLRPPHARTPTLRALGGPLAGAAPRRRLERLAAPERTREAKQRHRRAEQNKFTRRSIHRE